MFTLEAYSELKLAAIKEVAQEITASKNVIDDARNSTVKSLKTEYETILSNWDTNKAELESETKMALLDMQNVLKEKGQLDYNQRIVKTVVQIYMNTITPLQEYVDVTHLTDKSFKWSPNMNIASFKSIRGR